MLLTLLTTTVIDKTWFFNFYKNDDVVTFICQQVDVEVLDQHLSENNAYIIELHMSHLRIIRLKNGRRIKHAVDKDLKEKLSKPFFFVQYVNGSITQVFFSHNDQPEIVGLKKGMLKYSENY